jgi:hypothetical protein
LRGRQAEGTFLGEVLALVDAEGSLGMDAAAFACVLASDQWGQLEEGAF